VLLQQYTCRCVLIYSNLKKVTPVVPLPVYHLGLPSTIPLICICFSIYFSVQYTFFIKIPVLQGRCDAGLNPQPCTILDSLSKAPTCLLRSAPRLLLCRPTAAAAQGCPEVTHSTAWHGMAHHTTARSWTTCTASSCIPIPLSLLLLLFKLHARSAVRWW
jgi:hypothetical protein